MPTQARFVDVVGQIVLIWLAEVSLHGMAQCIKCTGKHLHLRHRHGVFRVKEGKICLCAKDTGFYLLYFVGNDCTGVHFGTCAKHGDDGSEGKRLNLTSALLLSACRRAKRSEMFEFWAANQNEARPDSQPNQPSTIAASTATAKP